jgi:hypothetical protein
MSEPRIVADAANVSMNLIKGHRTLSNDQLPLAGARSAAQRGGNNGQWTRDGFVDRSLERR